MIYKSERFEMRLSEREAQLLDQVRGAATRAAWVRNQIALAAKTEPEPIDVTEETATPLPDRLLGVPIAPDVLPGNTISNVHDEMIPGATTHRHRRGVKIGEYRNKGSLIQQYRCTEPGCTHVMEG